jgi:hypothetical protein
VKGQFLDMGRHFHHFKDGDSATEAGIIAFEQPTAL